MNSKELSKQVVAPYRENEPFGVNWLRPRIKDHFFKLSMETALLLSDYMWNGLVCIHFPSNSLDFDGKTEYPSQIFIDEKYIWDSTLAYFVGKYRADVPQEFKAHVLKQNSRPNDRLTWEDRSWVGEPAPFDSYTNTLRVS